MFTDNTSCYTALFTKPRPPSNPQAPAAAAKAAPTRSLELVTQRQLQPNKPFTTTKNKILQHLSITTNKEADAAPQAAVSPWIQLLPNADKQ